MMDNNTQLDGYYYPSDFKDAYSTPHVDVPIKPATPDNLRGYGHIVYDFHQTEVDIIQWPSTGKRKICPGTGKGGGIVEGDFVLTCNDGFMFGANTAVGDVGSDGKGFVIGRFLDSQKDVPSATHVLVRDLYYHPDGGQVFYPKQPRPYMMLLSKAGDDVTADDFEAFYFDGRCGFHVDPGVWHRPPYPVYDDRLAFLNKQRAVFACVGVDTVRECGKYLRVPLRL